MFFILKSNIKATHFYWDYGILGYSTSYKPKVHIKEYRSNQFDDYLQGYIKCNCDWQEMYISVFRALDSYLIVQHNEPLTETHISTLTFLVEVANERYQKEINGI